ncbi:MAG: zeta toxin family protein [Candidatus Paceibacterota bacterium]|jgi:predicted kinase|nr:zeta toxin family protein [Candidatus Paceibacterota bacterium]
MNNFDIQKEEVERIFREMIVPQTIGDCAPQEIKRAYILGGQPGSGKSAFAREILKTNNNIVFINGDDLRAYHPGYYFYLKENDIEAADRTQAVCNFWIESLLRECIKQGLDLIIEGTMRKKEVPMKTAKMLDDAGYETNLVVISTPYELSLRSLEYRYNELRRLGQPARFTKKESHDEAYENIEGTLSDLVATELFKRFFIYKRYDGGFEENIFETEQKENVLPIFREGRLRTLEHNEKDRRR